MSGQVLDSLSLRASQTPPGEGPISPTTIPPSGWCPYPLVVLYVQGCVPGCLLAHSWAPWLCWAPAGKLGTLGSLGPELTWACHCSHRVLLHCGCQVTPPRALLCSSLGGVQGFPCSGPPGALTPWGASRCVGPGSPSCRLQVLRGGAVAPHTHY